MRHIATALALSVLVVGCAPPTVRNLRANVPVITTNSTKAPKVISDCITAEWFKTELTVNNIPRAGGMTLVLQSAAPVAAIDIDERPDGSFVEVHLLKTVFAKRDRKFANRIRACL